MLILGICLLIGAPAMSETDAQAERHTPVFRTARERDALQPKDSAQHAGTATGSFVDHRNRSYSTETTGMGVKIPGGRGAFNLTYEDGAWLAGEARSDLTGFPSPGGRLQFTEVCQDYDTPIITSILKDGRYAYNLPPDSMRKVTKYDASGNVSKEYCEYVGERIYLHDGEKMTFVIRTTDDGYRWQDTYGNWKQYAGDTDDDTSGRLLASGNRLGTTLTVLYEDGTGRVTGYADRRDALVFWLEYNTEGLLDSVQDADTRQITYRYDTEGRLSSVLDVSGDETTYTYHEDGKITKISKPGGREVNVTYTTYGDVASVTDAGGRGYRFNFTYDAQKEEYYALVTSTSGRITEYWYDDEGETTRIDINGETVRTITKDGNAEIITDERGYRTRKEYDEWDNLTNVVYPDGATLSYQYEHTYNRRTQAVDERGNITTYTYNGGNLIEQVEAAGTDDERVTEYDYDDNGDLKSISLQLADGSLAVTSMEYDANGNLTQITDPEQHVIRFSEYDNMGNVRTMLDARGKTWQYRYDAMGRLTAITDPLSQTTARVYDAAGNLAKVIAPAGDGQIHETIYSYDLHDQLISIQDAAGGITTFSYNDDGKLLTQVDPALREITYDYDEFGRQIRITDGNDNVITLEYDSLSSSTGSCSSCSGGGQSLPARVISPSGLVTTFRYDTRSRKTEARQTFTDPDTREIITQITRYRYDPSGNLIEQIDPEGHSTSYTYDALNRLATVTDEIGRTTYSYNALGNLTGLTDAESQTTTFTYDLNGRLVAETRPLGQTTQYYHYDGAGNLTLKTDATLKEISYVYDDAGRLIALTSDAPDLPATVSGPGMQSQQCTFSYDAAGNLTSYDDGLTSASYAYDALNRKTSETLTYSANLEGLSGALTKRFSYTYTANSLTSSFTMPDGATYTYEYGENNELKQVSLPGVGAITYPSYTWTRPDRISFPGGGTRTYTYDPLMRLRRLLASDPGGNALLDVQYQYDRRNNILTKTTPQGTVNYTYDAISRLTGVQVETPTAGQPDEGFTYDKVGNRTTEERIEGEWHYNANNELLTFANTAYSYDANGNAVQITLNGTVMFTYHYNTFDRLVQVDDVNENTIAEYYYDPFGRRLWKQAGDETTLFFYSDEGLVAEYDPTDAEIRTYGYRPDATWTTDPLWLQQDGEYYFYHNDHLGTPQKLVKQNGAVVWSASYTAFGQATVGVETITNNLRFPGQYEDAETGLHYNFQRYYAPGIGRYMRIDPIGIHPQGIHAYLYVENTPTIATDPLGLEQQRYCKVIDLGTADEVVGGPWKNILAHNILKVTKKFKLNKDTGAPMFLCWNRSCPIEQPVLEEEILYYQPGRELPSSYTAGENNFPYTWTWPKTNLLHPKNRYPLQPYKYCYPINTTTAITSLGSGLAFAEGWAKDAQRYVRLKLKCCTTFCSL